MNTLTLTPVIYFLCLAIQTMNPFKTWPEDNHREVWMPEEIKQLALNRHKKLFLLLVKRVDGQDMEQDSLTSRHLTTDR